ncbi:Aste57867_13597 [Aphanomyces stellatus]|uniref:Aste57867_13597 protein n=1 Tax=Aphanomyces stellatus TaxID=120398 RepID=A0A485KZ24_9STRA|nr:hypothetical protein As57867_013547 [Aphanomyces stellatus]VFT90434.1 Aste57867_13597 [Aphanomyces stellatus]
MEDDDCYGFGSYDDIFSRPTASNVIPNGDAETQESPGKVTLSSSTSAAVEVGTHLLQHGFFVMEHEIKFSTDDALFHGYHIGLKIKRSGKHLSFNFPRQDPLEVPALKVCVDSNAGNQALGDLYMDEHELFWRPMRHSDTVSGQVYGSDRFSVRISRKHIKHVAPTNVQNIILALSITLTSMDVSFEFSFMPGPYHKTTKRDELLGLLQDTPQPDAEPSAEEMQALFGHADPPPVSLSPEKVTTPEPSPAKQRNGQWKDGRNDAVRRYLSMDASSDQAMALAATIEREYKYAVGPTTRTTPSFLDDKEYRQEQVATLSRVMDRMKSTWKRNEESMDTLLSVRCGKNDDDDLVYFDAKTKKEISAKGYELRYREHITQPPIILRNNNIPPPPTQLQQSAILDSSFHPSRQFVLPTVPTSLQGEARAEAELERIAFMEEIQESHRQLWHGFARLAHAHFEKVQSIRAMCARSMDERVKEKAEGKMLPARDKSNRRRSMVPAPIDELKENQSDNKKRKGGPDEPNTKRKPRRQSIVAAAQMAEEESKSEDEVNLCNLCFVSTCTVVLQPCLHSVCDKCWSKLSQGQDMPTIQCPWDRQDVVPERVAE